MARRYRPTLRPALRAIAALCCAGIGLGLLLGALWPALGRIGDIVLLGTLARALLVGLLLRWVIDRTTFANAWAAAAIAALATLLAIAGAHYQRHVHNRSERVAAADEVRLQSKGYGRDAKEVDREYAEIVSALTFEGYLRGYFGFTNGGRSMRRDATSNQGGPAFGLGLYAFELLAALLASSLLVARRASEPACSKCQRWLVEGETKKFAHGQGSEFVLAMENGAWRDAEECLRPPDTDEYVGLALSTCPSCSGEGEAVLRVREFSRPRDSRELACRHLSDLVVSREEAALLGVCT